MITVVGEVKYVLDYTVQVDMTEEQWDLLRTADQNEIIDGLVVDSGQMKNVYLHSAEVYDIFTKKEG
jgi:hypothetical protein